MKNVQKILTKIYASLSLNALSIASTCFLWTWTGVNFTNILHTSASLFADSYGRWSSAGVGNSFSFAGHIRDNLGITGPVRIITISPIFMPRFDSKIASVSQLSTLFLRPYSHETQYCDKKIVLRHGFQWHLGYAYVYCIVVYCRKASQPSWGLWKWVSVWHADYRYQLQCKNVVVLHKKNWIYFSVTRNP